MMAEYTKLQKVLLLKAAVAAFYVTAIFGDRIGMPSFSEKFFDSKNNALRKSASDWAGLGLLIVTIDLLYAALKCSKAVQQRVCNGHIMHNMLLIAVHMCTSSKKYGGAVVHKEHVMGSFISTALSFILATGLTNGMEPAKRHFLMGCKGLTHGCNHLLGMFLLLHHVLQFCDFRLLSISPVKEEASAEQKIPSFTT